MAISANAIARGAVAAVGVILLAIATPARVGRSAGSGCGGSTRRACPLNRRGRRRDLAFG